MSDYTSTFTESTGDTIDTTDFSTEFDAIQTASATKADSTTLTARTADLNTKIVNIGDWDMDATATVNIAHGLTLSKIRAVSVMIRNDADTSYTSLEHAYQTNALQGAWQVDATNVDCTRWLTGQYDSVNYDSTSYNRGWIIIQYTD